MKLRLINKVTAHLLYWSNRLWGLLLVTTAVVLVNLCKVPRAPSTNRPKWLTGEMQILKGRRKKPAEWKIIPARKSPIQLNATTPLKSNCEPDLKLANQKVLTIKGKLPVHLLLGNLFLSFSNLFQAPSYSFLSVSNLFRHSGNFYSCLKLRFAVSVKGFSIISFCILVVCLIHLASSFIWLVTNGLLFRWIRLNKNVLACNSSLGCPAVFKWSSRRLVELKDPGFQSFPRIV